MPTWLSDPTPLMYVLLTIVVLAALWGWFRSSQTWKVNVLVVLILLGVVAVIVIDQLIESPREEAVRKLETMAEAANARRWDDVFEHVSDQFQYHSSDKAAFRGTVEPNAVRHEATVNFKSFDRENAVYLSDNEIRIGYIAQVSAPVFEVVPYYVVADFGRDTDGQFRLTGFKVYNIARREQGGEELVPGLP